MLTFASDHPELRPPRVGEAIYTRRSVIEFAGVSSLVWTGQGVPPARDANGEQDWDAIDVFTWQQDTYRLMGEFGEIQVRASSVSVQFIGPA